MNAIAQLAATFAVNGFLIVGSLFYGSVAAVTGALDSASPVPYRCARRWASWLVRLAGIRIDLEFEDEVATGASHKGRPTTSRAARSEAEKFVFFANHQSLYDIPVLLHTLPQDARFLAKKSLFSIPIFGFAMRKAGFVPVDRGAGASAAKAALRAASDQLAEGHSILLFPEETRSLNGRILPFKAGGVLIALRAGVRIVPIGLSGVGKVRPKGSVLMRPGPVRVRYGAPVDPRDYGVRGKRELLDMLRNEVARLSGEELESDRE